MAPVFEHRSILKLFCLDELGTVREQLVSGADLAYVSFAPQLKTDLKKAFERFWSPPRH